MINLHSVVDQTFADWFLDYLILHLERLNLLIPLNKWTSRELGVEYLEIAMANYEQLVKFREQVDVSEQTFSRPKDKVVHRLKAVYNEFANKKIGIGLQSKSQRINAHDYIFYLGALCCPYCNFNSVENKIGKGTRVSQIDHFYPKSIYPLFAMSFYNLIPSCSACNKDKRDMLVGVSPFTSRDLLLESRFTFTYREGLEDGNFEFEAKYEPRGDLKENDRIIGISDYYLNKSNYRSYQSLASKMNSLSVKDFNEKFAEFNIEKSARVALENYFMFTTEKLDFIRFPRAKQFYDILDSVYSLERFDK